MRATKPTNVEENLFSRTHPLHSRSKKIRGFLGLPGELRNRIYDYYFDHDFQVEIAAKGAVLGIKVKRPEIVKLSTNLITTSTAVAWKNLEILFQQPVQTIRMPRRLGRYARVDGIQTQWSRSFSALVLTCRQVHEEAIMFLYQNTAFAFAAPRRIINFLGTVPRQNVSCITKLHLYYISYGCPFLAVNRIWATKHVESWTTACKSASKQLVNLQHLQIGIRVNEGSPQFTLRQHWLQPLLQFRRLSYKQKPMSQHNTGANNIDHARTLKTVEVDFNTYWSDGKHFLQDNSLSDLSKYLHHLFGKAISGAILGASEEVAMEAFNAAWKDCTEWHHHLNFSTTYW